MNRTREALSKTRQPKATKSEVFQSICLDVSENLLADLTSVWFFDKEQTQIECQCCYDALAESFSKGQILRKEDFPKYFERVIEDNVISAPDALNHSATKDLTEPYFRPKGIISLLDFILHRNYTPVGVICCENRKDMRNWKEADIDYLRSIAALTSFHFHFSN
ncbi:MAG: GAF domain-containing protein [Verrucomicrobiota bacterium]